MSDLAYNYFVFRGVAVSLNLQYVYNERDVRKWLDFIRLLTYLLNEILVNASNRDAILRFAKIRWYTCVNTAKGVFILVREVR